MKRKRFGEEQIIGILNEQEASSLVREITRRHEIAEQAFYRWKSKYGGMSVSDARKLKVLEEENMRLKKLLADQIAIVRDNGSGPTGMATLK